MTGTALKLIKFMSGADKRFVIPVYQRNYDWRKENCKQLFDDLVMTIRKKRNSHFFGSIVSVYSESGANEDYLIIDGQQRLTTVSLLLLAMHNLIVEGKIVPEDQNLSVKLYEEYLVDKFEPFETRVKLKPIKNDRVAFNKLFDDVADYDESSNLTINYRYFYDRILREEISVDELFNAVVKLEIISIKLGAEDDPQLIFESLNSTGLDLTEGDKVRNYILMSLDQSAQEKYYEKYWNKIEELVSFQVDLFIRDYLSIKQQLTPPMSSVYVAFKRCCEKLETTTEALLTELLTYARFYSILIKGSTSDKKLAACINRLNRLETTVTRPFFMEVLRLNYEKAISNDDLLSIFLMTENYLVRRSVCDIPTNALNKIFLLLNNEVLRYDGTAEHYLEKLRYAFLTKGERGRFPTDEEFSDAFTRKQVYNNPRLRVYLLERFENFGTEESKAVYEHIDDGEYSVEHIMPQHLTPQWKDDLGADYERVFNEWRHRIANLTLTAYNSKYSNRSFKQKRDHEQGFKESGLKINQWIAKQEQWTEEELIERNKVLLQKALTIWARPSTSYCPPVKELEFCTLADDESELTGRKIASFEFQGLRQYVKTWRVMFERVAAMLYERDPSLFKILSVKNDKSNWLYGHVGTHPTFFKNKNSFELDTDVYMTSHSSTATKISVLRALFDAEKLDQNDLVFYLREGESEDDEDA